MSETPLNEATANANNCSLAQSENEIAKRKSIDNVENVKVTETSVKIEPNQSASDVEDNKMTDKLENGSVNTAHDGEKTANEPSSELEATDKLTTENNNVIIASKDNGAKVSESSAPAAACGWCHDARSPLSYILPTLTGESLAFCTEMCIVEFRKAVKKGACKQCGNAIRSMGAPNKDYCSTFCQSKSKPKNGKFFHSMIDFFIR